MYPPAGDALTAGSAKNYADVASKRSAFAPTESHLPIDRSIVGSVRGDRAAPPQRRYRGEKRA
jgi:hypothetical protein